MDGRWGFYISSGWCVLVFCIFVRASIWRICRIHIDTKLLVCKDRHDNLRRKTRLDNVRKCVSQYIWGRYQLRTDNFNNFKKAHLLTLLTFLSRWGDRVIKSAHDRRIYKKAILRDNPKLEHQPDNVSIWSWSAFSIVSATVYMFLTGTKQILYHLEAWKMNYRGSRYQPRTDTTLNNFEKNKYISLHYWRSFPLQRGRKHSKVSKTQGRYKISAWQENLQPFGESSF